MSLLQVVVIREGPQRKVLFRGGGKELRRKIYLRIEHGKMGGYFVLTQQQTAWASGSN